VSALAWDLAVAAAAAAAELVWPLASVSESV
jgi:hypothetical protein